MTTSARTETDESTFLTTSPEDCSNNSNFNNVKHSIDWTMIQSNHIPVVPEYIIYDVNSIATFSIPNLTKVIVNGILDTCRLCSLKITYHIGTTYNNPYIVCQDMDGIKFHVLLWKLSNHNNNNKSTRSLSLYADRKTTMLNRSSNNKTDDDEMMFIEVRYIGGDESMIFYQKNYTQLFLQAVQQVELQGNKQNVGIKDNTTTISQIPAMTSIMSDDDTDLSSQQNTINIPYSTSDPLFFDMTNREQDVRMYESLQHRMENHNSARDQQEQVQYIMDRVQYCMSSDNLECVYEGLAMLMHVTNPTRSGYRVAEQVASRLLTTPTLSISNSNNNNLSGSGNITMNMILSLGLYGCWYHSNEMDFVVAGKNNNDTNSNMNVEDDDMFSDPVILRDYTLYSLRIIGQALNVATTKDVKTFTSNVTVFLQQTNYNPDETSNSSSNSNNISIQSILLQHILYARDRPRRAYCAAHILAKICEHDGTIRSYVQGQDTITETIYNARNYGCVSNVAIQSSCQRLLSVIGK